MTHLNQSLGPGYLPAGLWSKILLDVPDVASCFRVSKFFRQLIGSREFVLAHKRRWQGCSALHPHQIRRAPVEGYSRLLLGTEGNQTPIDLNNPPIEKVRLYAASVKEGPAGLYVVSPAEADKLKTALIALYEEKIREHIDRRIQIFYFQSAACAGTGNQFSAWPRAIYQDDRANSFRVIVEQSCEDIHTKWIGSIHAAHSSTLPTLQFRTPAGEQIYLFGTDYFRACQTTIGIPSFVNRSFDQAIDNKLRPFALAQLNSVSGGGKTPDEALRAFAEELWKLSNDYWVNSFENDKSQWHQLTGGYCAQQARKWVEFLKVKPAWFSQALCRCSSQDKQERQQVYYLAQTKLRLRLQIMSDYGLLLQQFIEDHLDKLQDKDRFHLHFADYVIKQAPNDQLRQELAKYYNYSGSLATKQTLVRSQEEGKRGLVQFNKGLPVYAGLFDAELQKAIAKAPFSDLYTELRQHWNEMVGNEHRHRRDIYNQLANIFGLPDLKEEPPIETKASIMEIGKELCVHESLFYLYFEGDIPPPMKINRKRGFDSLTN